MEKKPVYYGEYLQLDKILNAQFPESDKAGIKADDEMLFIIIHQAYELWFKQILHEVKIVGDTFGKPSLPENAPDLQNVVHRLKRVTTILKVLVEQVDILETMTPLDFLDFRDLLRPASGFQSFQFKILEAALGLKFDHRYGQNYYTQQLKPEDLERVKSFEKQRSLIQMLNDWLERMPFFNDNFWQNFSATATDKKMGQIFWNEYRHTYLNSLTEGEKANIERFDLLLNPSTQYPADRSLSAKANRGMLFIMLYRDYPMLQLPYQLLNTLLDIDELLAQWRYRHMNMVHRMIGTRVGTGGSTGKDYLKGALDKHYIFKEIAEMTSFLINRNRLPQLTPTLQTALGYGK